MKKKLLSLCLITTLSVQVLPFQVVNAAPKLPTNAKTAFAGVLNNYVDLYGTTEYTTISQHNRIEGLVSAELADFDGDGINELYTNYLDGTTEGVNQAIKEKIWQFNGTEAETIFEKSQYSTGSGDYGFTNGRSIYHNNQISYLVDSEFKSEASDAKNTLIKTTNLKSYDGSSFETAIVIEETFHDNYYGDDGKDSGENRYAYELKIDGNSILSFDTKTQKDFSLSPSNLDNLPTSYRNLVEDAIADTIGEFTIVDTIYAGDAQLLKWNNDTSLVAELNLPDMVIANLDSVKSALPYTGDLSDMNMSHAQALAFLQVLTPLSSSPTVSLFDTGNGTPAMYLNANDGEIYVWNGESVDRFSGTLESFATSLSIDVSNLASAPLASAITALKNYSDAALTTYTYPDRKNDSELLSDLNSVLSDKVSGDILAVYELASGFFYIAVNGDDSVNSVLVNAILVDGEPQYQVGEPLYGLERPSTLDKLAIEYELHSNITIDYDVVSGLTKASELTSYLETALLNITGLEVNDQAKSDIVTYIENAITKLATTNIKSSDNGLVLSSETISDTISSVDDTRAEFENLLSEHGITLNKEIQIAVNLILEGVSPEEAIQIQLNTDMNGVLNGTYIRIYLEDGTHGFELASDDLDEILTTDGEVTISLEPQNQNTYAVNFLNAEGTVLEQISAPVNISFPSNNEFSTIIATINGVNDNWGGQFDSISRTISFDTSFSGIYMTIDNTTEIMDIDQEYADMIQFVVSKGFLAIDENGNFYPDDELNRYDFTRALVRMFFALDRDLETSFSDVAPDSPYYSFVASAEHGQIVEGFDDGTFKGENPITTEQVLALVARTLVDQKGYRYPDSVSSQLTKVNGAELTSDWAQREIALAIREGVMVQGESISPQENITREQSAVYLYRLFMLLEEVSVTETVPTETGANTTSSDSMNLTVPIIIGASVAGVAIILALVAIILKRRK